VLVEDGAIVVLGGLLQDEYAGNNDRVPGLADIPIFGNLFKSEARSRKKTNLMVFLRPVVVRDAAGAEALSAGRYDQMRKRTGRRAATRERALAHQCRTDAAGTSRCARKCRTGVCPVRPVPQ